MRVQVDEENLLVLSGEPGGYVDSCGGLSGSAFVVQYANDQRWPSRFGMITKRMIHKKQTSHVPRGAGITRKARAWRG